MIWHNATPEEVIEELESNAETGLETSDADERLKEHGFNLSVIDEDISLLKSLTSQLKKPSVIVLLFLLLIFVLRELVLGTDRFFIPIVALLMLAFKEAVSIYLEYRCVNMLFRLKNRIRTSAKVVRSSTEYSLSSTDLVPGDIIKLNEGDFVPADARLIDSFALRCDESVLYGEKETVSVQKDHTALHEDHTPLQQRTNMLYCGCYIMTGSATAIVTETGENAEIRRLFKRERVFAHKGVQDRISDRFSSFLKVFLGASLTAAVLITLFGTFFTHGNTGWGKFLEAMITATSLYIAVFPEKFSARIASMLALGIKRIEIDKAVIFNPSTVEKLAGVTTICSDKTGTLTQNRMVLREVYDGEKLIDLGTDNITKRCEIAMRFGSLSCDAVDTENLEMTDFTEVALISAALRHLSLGKTDFDAEFPRIASIPLTPERKIKTSVNMIEGKIFSIVRGAPDIILERCIGADNDGITKAYEDMCSKGMRVLAISYKIMDDIPSEPSGDDLEYGLEFLGLLGLVDRERKGITDDIRLCRGAGISTVMFTGDHINTASSTAEKMGILSADDLAVTGEQLDELSNEELTTIIDKIKVCARISPEQRVRIVNALHENGHTVLITADSAANHAPMAIADIGCAMGKTGTDVAKGNADLMIYDDSFSTIVKAIKNARGIFANFTKYIEYYITMCSCIFMFMMLSIVFFKTSLLSPQLLLLGSAFTLLFPITALGLETADNSIMKQPPWNIGQKMFDVKRLGICAGAGAASAIPSVLVYLIDRSTASAFFALILSLIFFLFSSQSTDLFHKLIMNNRFLFAIGSIFAAVALIIAITPIARIFSMAPMSFSDLLFAILLPLTIPLSLEGVKLYFIMAKQKD